MSRLSVFALVAQVMALGTSESTWNRPNSLLPNDTAATYGCTGECLDNLYTTTLADREYIFGTVPFDADFYATASNFTNSSKPGDVLKLEPFINATKGWTLPYGSALYRMQYVSVAVDEEIVPATAFVVLPFSNPLESAKFPLVAFSHGTIGVNYGCAPSSTMNMYDYQTWFQLTYNGYAVVGPDYVGLGNNYTLHPYLANALQANDLYYSAVAAKKAFPGQVTDNWTAIGHSQGGGSVWALAESEHAQLDDTFIGGVSLSPAIRPLGLVGFWYENNLTAPILEYSTFIHWGMEVTSPGSASDLLSDALNERLPLAEQLGVCFYANGGLSQDLYLSGGLEAVYKDPSSIPTYKGLADFEQKYSGGLGRQTYAPMLVISSIGDSSIPISVITKGWQDTCEASTTPVRLTVYPNVDHSATPAASSPEWLKWMQDAFAGTLDQKRCEIIYPKAVNAADSYLPLDF